MIITLSPAKILDFESPIPSVDISKPIFSKEAVELNSILRKLSIEEIISIMKVNPELAQNTLTDIYAFGQGEAKGRQAAFVYNGIAYQGLDAKSMTEEDFSFAQKHLVILSGLYGMLRPLDAIESYRLEMQAKLKSSKGANLYDFWREILSLQMAKILEEDDNIWINLASKEYEKVINRKLLPKDTRIITPVFKETTGDDYKQVTVHAKKARGMMTRFIIRNRLKDVEHLKAFDSEGYAYSSQLSNDKEWTFVR